jgi:hydrogenase maturation protease
VRTLVIGVGNADRGDDGAGPAVVRALTGRVGNDMRLVTEPGDAASLIATWNGAEHVIAVDASVGDATPGTIRRFDATKEPLPAAVGALSSHGFGLAAALELARALNELPPRCTVYAIAGKNFSPGAPLSPAVAAAVEATAQRILGDG